ncbi:alpha/beta hydrolase [Nocardioides rubriscoriae]|uniref:alpha/beta hydrolase n=1 Tax=Nocardioides rubriscoriae TaxID=642762 RepID=UPI0011DFBBF8|nr:alpha/beta hydrolase [Nocardioides rubriscoriae]
MLRRTTALISMLACTLAATTVVAPSEASPASSASSVRAEAPRVISREITFEVSNTNRTSVPCLPTPDGRQHRVSARLIGPADVVRGHGGAGDTFHVLVHDAGTGGWFWNLHGRGISPQQDYAAQLARRGQTVVVLDRLGYDRSPLRNGDATCLGAQASMLSQVVQSLYAATYTLRSRPGAATSHASHVVLHGHGTGATVARLEAATYSDVQALVLMSPVTGNPSALALQTLREQGTTCLQGASYAPYGNTARTFRRLLFATASPAVQRAAVARRNSTPCGDVASLLAGVLAAQGQAVDVPTLVLRGSADARRGGDGITGTSHARLVRRTFAGAGSALPLERQAPAVRRAVMGFVRSLDPTVR